MQRQQAAEIEKQQQEQQQLTAVTTKTQNVQGEDMIVTTTSSRQHTSTLQACFSFHHFKLLDVLKFEKLIHNMSPAAIPCLCFLLLLLPHPSLCTPPRKLALVPASPTVLTYHQGPLLTGPSPITLYYLWYGSFTPAQKAILTDFASSFSSPPPSSSSPSVASWWSIATSYTDDSHAHVSSSVTLAKTSQASVSSSSPTSLLKKTDILSVLLSSLSSKSLPVDPKGLYFIFTADDVPVEDFCMNSCGFHDSSPASATTNNLKLPYAWVGNPGKQCPGYCAWPFALPEFGPQTPPLVSPNNDVGVDGMVINMATVLAGAATNPFDTGYFQGDAGAPLEAVSACTGVFGKGAFPGNPGSLLTDQKTGASYNAHGANGRLFLLPAMWSPASQMCTPLS